MSQTLDLGDMERDLRDHLLRERVSPQLADGIIAIVRAHAPKVAAVERERIARLADDRKVMFRESCDVTCPEHGAHPRDARPFSELLHD